MKTLLGYIRLTRPANIVTAIADILAGISVAIYFSYWEISATNTLNAILFLSLSTIGLYGGGVVMNDVADAELDAVERPERPIPSGLASKQGAKLLGFGLLTIGIFFAMQVSFTSGLIAALVAGLALLYDFKGKHYKFLGPINMGLCRGGNLLLGISASIEALQHFYFLAIIPVVYISAITMISRGEVVGGNKLAIRYAMSMYSFVIVFLSILNLGTPCFCFQGDKIVYPFISITLFAILIYKPLISAHNNPEPMNIRKAVKAGVISLIVMDASLASIFAGWQFALVVILMLPVSMLLAKIFAVT